MNIKIINKSKNSLPAYETEHAAGMDLRADVEEIVYLRPMERKLIGTGLHIELPVGFEAQIRPRSGLAIKNGVTLVNSPGTIDADYRGEISVIVINHGEEAFTIEPGMRIAQMVISVYQRITWNEVDNLDSTVRGAGGFGSTGC